MKLYTKQGDDGSTGLIGGHRVVKCDSRVTAYGEVDETNAAIGLAVAACDHEAMTADLRCIQSELFTLGAQLASPDGTQPELAIGDAHVAQLERWIDRSCGEAAPLKNFVLPGGCELAARLHFARTVCRRAERAAVDLAQRQSVGPGVLVYLNRLSDLLFALAREANARAGAAEIPWTPSKP